MVGSKKAGNEPKVSSGASSTHRECGLCGRGDLGKEKTRPGWPCSLLTFFPLTDPWAGIWPGAGIGGDGRWFLTFPMEKTHHPL